MSEYIKVIGLGGEIQVFVGAWLRDLHLRAVLQIV